MKKMSKKYNTDGCGTYWQFPNKQNVYNRKHNMPYFISNAILIFTESSTVHTQIHILRKIDYFCPMVIRGNYTFGIMFNGETKLSPF